MKFFQEISKHQCWDCPNQLRIIFPPHLHLHPSVLPSSGPYMEPYFLEKKATSCAANLLNQDSTLAKLSRHYCTSLDFPSSIRIGPPWALNQDSNHAKLSRHYSCTSLNFPSSIGKGLPWAFNQDSTLTKLSRHYSTSLEFLSSIRKCPLIGP